MILFAFLVVAAGFGPAFAMPQKDSQRLQQQESKASPKPDARDEGTEKKSVTNKVDTSQENTLGLQTIKNIVRDQKEIWTSPAHVRLGHAD